MKIMSLNYREIFITIAAVEFDRVKQFYRQILGKEPDPYLANVYAEFSLNCCKIGIFKPKKDHEAEFSYSYKSGLSLCIEVRDIEDAIAYLNNIGYQPTGNINHASHGKEIYIYDPGGNRLILHQANKNKY